MKFLQERNKLFKGIFWAVYDPDVENIEDCNIISLPIYCDRDGNTDKDFIGNSKDGTNNTHKNSWKDLVVNQPKRIKREDWNYFPRGRVEISNNSATIYANPIICNSNTCIEKIIYEFGLENIDVNIIADGSNHYHCYLD